MYLNSTRGNILKKGCPQWHICIYIFICTTQHTLCTYNTHARAHTHTHTYTTRTHNTYTRARARTDDLRAQTKIVCYSAPDHYTSHQGTGKKVAQFQTQRRQHNNTVLILTGNLRCRSILKRKCNR